jgi:Cu(I)/Ag(I) efflux system membrane protein CusA/SilA
MMTVLATIIGLVPIMLGDGAGSDVMQRIAGPMIGGMTSTLVLTLLVLPAIFYVWKSQALKRVDNA